MLADTFLLYRGSTTSSHRSTVTTTLDLRSSLNGSLALEGWGN